MFIHDRFEKSDRVATFCLSAVKRAIGMLEQNFEVHSVFRRNRNADPDAQHRLNLADKERLDHGGYDASREDVETSQRAHIRCYNSEFVAAYAGQDRAGAHNLGDTPGKL